MRRMGSFSLPSFAKINLWLEVKGRRPDGYHELFTVFQTIDLRDQLYFEEAGGDVIELECDVDGIPTNGRNLVIKAAAALKEHFKVERGARIQLEKVIPAGGGLGGGSSNAAVTLLGLCRLWGIEPMDGELAKIARGLGADVPFFLIGGTAAGTGIGDHLTRMRDVHLGYLVVATPAVEVSTAEAYRLLNRPALTKDCTDIILSVSDAEAYVGDSLSSEPRNDFESVVFEIEPEVRRVKEKLTRLGAVMSLMSGSGSSVFGIFENREAQQFAFEGLKREADWRVFSCSTVSREEYSEAIGSRAGLSSN
jgi:4-diphosphocytidyl-2-C-methyl-D-erythritol kinase